MPCLAPQSLSMKDTQHGTDLVPRDERSILDEIRNDRDLIARLKITPKELEALSKCVLLGTLTCKQDMLFILRVIRDANTPASERAPLALPPPDQMALEEEVEAPEEDPAPDFRRIAIRVAPAAAAEPSSLESIVRRRIPEQFGVLFWVLVVVVGLAWSAVSVMSRWRGGFISGVGSAVAQAAPSQAWYSHLDRFNLLLSWELAFVASGAVITYLKY